MLETSAAEMLAPLQTLPEHEIAGTHRTTTERLAEIVTAWADSFAADREIPGHLIARTSAFFGASGTLQHLHKATQ